MSDEPNALPGPYKVGERISKATFLEMARAYRNNRQNPPTGSAGNKGDSRSCYFSRDIFEALLNTDCTGIRVYYGMRPEGITGQLHTNVMLVGVKKNPDTGKEEVVVVNDNTPGLEGEEGAFFDWGQLCPPDGNCEDNTLTTEIDQG